MNRFSRSARDPAPPPPADTAVRAPSRPRLPVAVRQAAGEPLGRVPAVRPIDRRRPRHRPRRGPAHRRHLPQPARRGGADAPGGTAWRSGGRARGRRLFRGIRSLRCVPLPPALATRPESHRRNDARRSKAPSQAATSATPPGQAAPATRPDSHRCPDSPRCNDTLHFVGCHWLRQCHGGRASRSERERSSEVASTGKASGARKGKAPSQAATSATPAATARPFLSNAQLQIPRPRKVGASCKQWSARTQVEVRHSFKPYPIET